MTTVTSTSKAEGTNEATEPSRKRTRRVGRVDVATSTSAEPTIATSASSASAFIPQHFVSKNDAAWFQRALELQDYKAVHGHTLVPQNYQPNIRLGRWVHYQRGKIIDMIQNGHV
jgi:hypothetical protein